MLCRGGTILMVSNYNKYPYLLDNQFLKDFDNLQLKEQFVCITVLDWTEKPVQQIQGKAVKDKVKSGMLL